MKAICLLIFLSAIQVAPQELNNCDYQKCKVGIETVIIEQKPTDIDWIAVDAKIVEVRHKKDFWMVKTTRSHSYCNDIPFVAQEEDCSSTNTVIYYEKKDVLRMREKKMCLVGRTCGPSDCWGSDSQTCKSNETTSWVGKQKLKDAPPSHHNMYHTCTQSWGCEIYDFNSEILVKDGEAWKYVVQTPIGESLEISSSSDLITTSLGYHVLTPDLDFETIMIKAHCIKSTTEKPLCIWREKGFVFDISADRKGFFRNYILIVPSNVPITMSSQFQYGFDASTKSDVHEIFNIFTYMIDQNILNTMLINNQLSNVMNIMRKLIMILNEANPKIMPSLINLDGVSLKISDEFYAVCPCKKKSSPLTACMSLDIKTKLLESKQLEVDSVCSSTSWNISHTKLFSSVTLDDDRIKEFEMASSTIDRYRIQVLEEAEAQAHEELNTKGTSDNGTFWLFDIFNAISGFMHQFMFVITYLNLFLTLYLLNAIIKRARN